MSFALDLPAAGFLTVRVFDARGRLMRRLAQGEAAGGSLILTWDGTDAAGRPTASGVYVANPGYLLSRAAIPRGAVITEFDSTTVVLPGYVAEIDRFHNILINPDGSGKE